MDPLTESDLAPVLDRLRDALDPVAIYLYGSHASGDPDAGSDIDLYVVVQASDEPSHRLEQRAYRALENVRMPVEVRVATLETFRKRRGWVNSLERTVAENGRVIYGAA